MIVTALCVFSLCAESVTVNLHASFDRSVSATIRAALLDESTAIWRDYGVELRWTADESPAALDLDVNVVRHRVPRQDDPSWSVLGRTALDESGRARGPIVVLIDSVESLVEPSLHANAVLRQQELGRALGRVLAHELGHVLLGTPTYHDSDGLMRPSFPPDDLIRRDRARFQLSNASIARLRARIPRLAVDAESARVIR